MDKKEISELYEKKYELEGQLYKVNQELKILEAEQNAGKYFIMFYKDNPESEYLCHIHNDGKALASYSMNPNDICIFEKFESPNYLSQFEMKEISKEEFWSKIKESMIRFCDEHSKLNY